jgi:hypothetical protein
VRTRTFGFPVKTLLRGFILAEIRQLGNIILEVGFSARGSGHKLLGTEDIGTWVEIAWSRLQSVRSWTDSA